MTMDTGLSRGEFTGPAGCSGRPKGTDTKFFRSGLIWPPISLVVALAAWVLLSRYSTTETKPVDLATTATNEPMQSQSKDGALNSFAAIPASEEAATPEQAAPPDGLKIASQFWRRGGLGSIALVTFTVRNTNAYAVKDIRITCAFNRRDGSHVTDRARVIHDTVNMKSRKTFARVHVGFVNVTADKAKCALVAASHA
jgi:type IV pilus biogenesis protein CpaD/CtpE